MIFCAGFNISSMMFSIVDPKPKSTLILGGVIAVVASELFSLLNPFLRSGLIAEPRTSFSVPDIASTICCGLSTSDRNVGLRTSSRTILAGSTNLAAAFCRSAGLISSATLSTAFATASGYPAEITT